MPAAGFTDDLHTRWLPGIGQWEITRTFEFHSGMPGSPLLVRCEAGMKTDLASVPLAVRWLVPKVGRDAQASAVHDRTYRDGMAIVRIGEREQMVPIARGVADSLYHEAMVALGVGWWRRKAIYSGLKVGGWAAWNRYREKGYGFATETTR